MIRSMFPPGILPLGIFPLGMSGTSKVFGTALDAPSTTHCTLRTIPPS